MQALREIYFEPDDVRSILLELFGVTEELFLQATARGWLEWATRTDFDPPSFPGSLLWGHTSRHERSDFCELGWKLDNTKNLASVISADDTTAIAVETGNRFTGRLVPGKEPRTNSKKGVQMMQMMADNRAILQGDLFAGYAQASEPHNKNAPLLWIHLIHQARGDVYGEVSLPIHANDRNRIVKWNTRIILPRWRGTDSPANLRNNPLEPTVDAEVRVVRRAG